ncbi:MAG: hypothetical protein NC212_08640 [Staphylococcus sp.]|nr:hypothetical protein [Staphylococcus sp.]
MEVSKSDLQKFIAYLDDAARLYEALATLPMQKCTCRSHMINQLTSKYKTKLNESHHGKTRHH